MAKPSFRTWLRRYYQRALDRLVVEADERELGRPAVIFAPHQDDETLGCGGTIIKKKRAGADVKIVFMTDGRLSHSHLMPSTELIGLRKREALAAARALGLGEADVFFLDFPDGRLAEKQEPAMVKVAEILEQYRPGEVYLPYSGDALPDHKATNLIVTAALPAPSPVVNEYPVWFWQHWPWVALPIQPRRESWQIFRNSLAGGLGLRLLKEFRYAVCIEDVIELKQAALQQHQSQMTRLLPDRRWLTLSDVSNGDFLACFFQKREIFRQHAPRGASNGSTIA